VIRLHRRAALAFAASVATFGRVRAQTAPLIAAASDLKFALEEFAAEFRDTHHTEIRLVFGSSGNFARQIRQGAPYELFLAADEDYVLALARDGYTRDTGDLYAIGRIVVMVPVDSPIAVDPHLDGIEQALASGNLARFAIANPEHAPYGLRAKQALESRGLWPALQPYLVFGENIAQTVQFVVAGAVSAGIGALSLALAPTLAGRQRHAVIPADWHEPLRQRMVLLAGAGAVAAQFYDWLRGARARVILRRYGFLLPGEDG
jgi:molybdate transport system substrate-binding protein